MQGCQHINTPNYKRLEHITLVVGDPTSTRD